MLVISNGVLTNISCDASGHLLNNNFDSLAGTLGSNAGALNCQSYYESGTGPEKQTGFMGTSHVQPFVRSGTTISYSYGIAGVGATSVFANNAGTAVAVTCSSSGSLNTTAVISATSGIQSLIDCGTSGMLPLSGVANGTVGVPSTMVVGANNLGNPLNTDLDGSGNPYVRSAAYAADIKGSSTFWGINGGHNTTSGNNWINSNPLNSKSSDTKLVDVKDEKSDIEVTRLKKLMRLKQLQKELDLEDSVFIVNPNYIDQKVK